MATLKKELREILERYDINPTDKSKLWDCHGTLVLYHRAYEIIAAQEGIKFDAPVLIEANGAEKIVAMLVTGHMKDRTEWSVGEAAPGNSKNAYPYAIAEKRGKDRVVAKLVGLAEYVYSEDEADEFKESKATQQPENHTATRTPAPNARPAIVATPAADEREAQLAKATAFKDEIKAAIEAAAEPTAIDRLLKVNAPKLQFVKQYHAATYDRLMELATARGNELRSEA